MRRLVIYILSLAALAFPLATRADTVVTRDGITRAGNIESRDDQEVRLRITRDGISGVMVIPMSQIARIILGGPTFVPTQPPTPALADAPSAATKAGNSAPLPQIQPASEAELKVYASRGFLAELTAGAAGHGLDDVDRLPGAYRDLWNRAMTDATGTRPADTLDALRQLESAMSQLPAGIERLDAITRRQRQESFGNWLALVHWDVIGNKYSTGQFDLSDVRASERPVLIGILKNKTASAVDPLRSYFPPVDESTGLPSPFRAAQLAGINASNALDVKDHALLAAAVILGQLKLEPDMPSVDRSFLSNQLGNVNRVLTRAREMEPLARAALDRAERDRRIAEDKAAREAAIAAQKAAIKSK